MEKIKFQFEGEDKSTEMFVLEHTSVSGCEYYLVSEVGNEDVCYILKDVSTDNSEDAIFEEVEDEVEWNCIAEIFQRLVDDDTSLEK